MDPRLLRAYNEELAYLREGAREFGEEHDEVASYLGLKTPNDPDPYVERLLEGVAYLSARIGLKLQDQFPEFTQQLLQAVQPDYLAPTPSMCVVEMVPQFGDDALAGGIVVPRHTPLAGSVASTDTKVIFRTSQAVTLYPFDVDSVEYLPTRASVAPYAATLETRVEAGLRVRLRAKGTVPLSRISPPQLLFYLNGAQAIPGELFRQICCETVAAIGQPNSEGVQLRLPLPEASGFDDGQAALPDGSRTFRGYRVLSEYFACPERFLFFAAHGLNDLFAASRETCDLVFLFNRSSRVLAGAVSAANLRLYTTPAVNLFELQLDRVPLDRHVHEHLVLPDRTRPLDYEVFRILNVVAHEDTGEAVPVAPLYAFGAHLYDWRDAIFYTTRMRPRRLSTREQRRRGRSEYTGTETLISLSSPQNPDRLGKVRELAVRALVTNRELPDLLRFGGSAPGFYMQGYPVDAVNVLRAPTRPRPPLGLGDSAWRTIAHLTSNYLSLVDGENGDPSLLQDHLALYGRADDAIMRRQVDGIRSVTSAAVTRRIPGGDRFAFARGRQIRIRLDDSCFDNGRSALFAAVVDRFLCEFCSVNSFTETMFESADQGEIVRWPIRAGLRPTI